MLRECVRSLLEQSYPLQKILIINSGISVKSLLLEFNTKQVHVIRGNQDWWWATCMNAGIEYALSNGAEYILAMNDDTYLESNALEYLLETSQKYNAIIGGIVKDKDNGGQMVNRGYGAKYTKYRWIPYKKLIGTINGQKIYYSEGQSGRGVLFPASIYREVGLYDIENFPHRGDRDFSYRCLKADIRQYLDSRAVVYLNFDTSYQGIDKKRFTFRDINEALFHINGLYNIEHQYVFLRKHYKYFWFGWFIIWFVPVIGICIFRMFPYGTSILKRYVDRKSYASNS